MSAPIILIDGSSYFYRAFHALPPLANSAGQPTGAVYMVKRLIKDYQPEYIAVVFDAKGKTFRDDWFPQYKAHRPPMLQDLRSQFEPMINILTAMGLPLLVIDGVEADDVIGTLAMQAARQNRHVLISTSDKDMAQLVNAHITLVNTMSNQILNPDGVKEKFGVAPEQIIDYLTLIGDTSDNIPGVHKCGPKTAVKWLEQYQTLDNLLAHAGDIGGKIGESLRACMAHLPLSKRLITLKTDVALPIQLEELSIKKVEQEALIALVRDLEFKSWLRELLNQTEQASAEPLSPGKSRPPVTIITTEGQLTDWVQKLAACKQFCIKTTSTNPDVMHAELVGISLAIERDNPVYIPLAHTGGSPQLSRDLVLAWLKPLLQDETIGKIGQNLKYEYSLFKQYDITLHGIVYDTMLASYVLESAANSYDLESLALKYLGYQALSLEDIAGKGVRQLRFDQIMVDKAAPFAAGEVDTCLKLHEKLYPMLPDPLKKIMNEIEIPLLTVLADMERHGVLIDKNTLARHGERLKTRLDILEKEAYQIAGRPFNLNSPKQLQEVLFDELALPIRSKTPTGQPSTAESVLQELALDFPLPAIILEYRSLSKLVSTYIDALPKREHPVTARVHTTYNQAVAATGRLSSSEPNLQNIPIRTEEGRLIRTAFIAPTGYKLLAADYSQIELRIMAHLSQDKNLRLAFENDWDIHRATASEIFQVELDDVTNEQRRRAKAVNFGLIYGMSAFGLSRQLGIERQDAQYYMDCYFKRYPGVLAYMERTRATAHQQGYVETIFGRRLHLPEINTRNMMRQKAAERAAINAPMQGTAADIIKRAMLAIAKWQASQPA